jgi:hypothetical protein
MRLRRGGSIVSSAACTPDEITIARAEGRLFVDKDEFGYVYRPTKSPGTAPQ